MLALTHLTPRLSACPLLPSGGPLGPAALGFGQAPQKAPYSNDPASKHESCFCFSWTPHFHDHRSMGIHCQTQKPKIMPELHLSSRDDTTAVESLTSLLKDRKELSKVAQLPGSQTSPQFHFTTMLRAGGHPANQK